MQRSFYEGDQSRCALFLNVVLSVSKARRYVSNKDRVSCDSPSEKRELLYWLWSSLLAIHKRMRNRWWRTTSRNLKLRRTFIPGGRKRGKSIGSLARRILYDLDPWWNEIWPMNSAFHFLCKTVEILSELVSSTKVPTLGTILNKIQN